MKTQSSLAYLNFGQNVIFSSALSTAMVLSSYGIMSGALTVGDLVTISSMFYLFLISLAVEVACAHSYHSYWKIQNCDSVFKLLD